MIEKNASSVTYLASSSAFLFGMTANELAAVGGLCIAALGFIVNWWYKAKADKRAEAAWAKPFCED